MLLTDSRSIRDVILFPQMRSEEGRMRRREPPPLAGPPPAWATSGSSPPDTSAPKRQLNFITLVSLLAIGGVFVGVAALTIVLSVMNGFEDQVQQRIAGTNAHVAVLDGDDRPLRSDPHSRTRDPRRDARSGGGALRLRQGDGGVAARRRRDGR